MIWNDNLQNMDIKIYHQKNLKSKRCRFFMTKPLQLYEWPPPNATAAARMICEAKSGSSPCRVPKFKTSTTPQKTGHWPVFCIEMFGFFSFFEKLNRISLPFFLAELPKKGMSNWATNQKKTSQEKSTESTHHSLTSKVFTAISCALWQVKVSTEHWKIPMGSDRQEHVYIQPLRGIPNPLKLQSKCWKLSPQRWINPGRKTLHFPIDFSSIFRERPQTTTAIQKVSQPCDLLCWVLIEAGDVFFPTYKYIWIPTEYYLLRAHLSTTKNCLQCLGISRLSSSTNQKTHILPQSSKSSHWTVTCLAWTGSRHFFPYQKMWCFLRSPRHLRILDTLDIVKLHQGALERYQLREGSR